MFRFFILLYGLSLIQAYTIKVSGKVELGSQLSKLFKDLYSQLVENGVIPMDLVQNSNEQNRPEIQYDFPGGNARDDSRESDSNSHMNKDKRFKKHRKKKEKYISEDSEAVKDIPVLDKMMKHDLEKLHLYGYHKNQEKKPGDFAGDPLNNVHI